MIDLNKLRSDALKATQGEWPPVEQYDAAAHMYPLDLETFKREECSISAFSIPVGSPTHGKSVPLWTTEQMREYAERFNSPSTTLALVAVVEAAGKVIRDALDQVEVHPCDCRDDEVRAMGLSRDLAALREALKPFQKEAA